MCFVIFLILPSLGRLEALLEVLVPAFVPLICTDASFQTVPDAYGSFVAEDPEQNSSYRDHYLVRFELQLHSMSLFKQIMLSQDEHSAPPIAMILLPVQDVPLDLPTSQIRISVKLHATTRHIRHDCTSRHQHPIISHPILWYSLVIISDHWLAEVFPTGHDITHVIQLIPTDSNWYLWWRSKVLFVGSPASPDVSHGSADHRGSNGSSRSAQPMSWTPFQALCWIEWRRWKPISLKIIK